MRKFDLGGTWRMTGGGYAVEGKIPGSVYSFLHVDNAILPDPHVADNEDIYLEISEHDYTFSRTFDWWDEGYRTTLVFEGLDTLCSVYLNGTHVSDTDNMHLRYEFDITELVREHNELCVVCHSPTKFIREQDEKAKLFGATDCMRGYPHLRKAHCMMGWDWGPRLPDAGIWRDVYLLPHDHSGRILDARVTQRHENGRVFLTPIMEFVGEGTPECWLTAPDGSVTALAIGVETEVQNPQLWWPNGLGEQPLYTVQAWLVVDMEIIDDRDIDSSVVSVGSLVTVDYKEKGCEVVYHIVGSYETDPRNGKISDVSPIGSALVGSHAGDALEVELPNGKKIHLTVKSVERATA